jgi:hypothetical protein
VRRCVISAIKDFTLALSDLEFVDKVNFVAIDSRDQLWVSVTTRELPFWPALVRPRPDGYIMLIDDLGPRVVAAAADRSWSGWKEFPQVLTRTLTTITLPL